MINEALKLHIAQSQIFKDIKEKQMAISQQQNLNINNVATWQEPELIYCHIYNTTTISSKNA